MLLLYFQSNGAIAIKKAFSVDITKTLSTIMNNVKNIITIVLIIPRLPHALCYKMGVIFTWDTKNLDIVFTKRVHKVCYEKALSVDITKKLSTIIVFNLFLLGFTA